MAEKRLRQGKRVSTTTTNEPREGRALGPRARATREAILQAALELFSRDGSRAGTALISERAGITERIIFMHFGSKERLFTETLFRAFATLTAAPLPTVIIGRPF